MCKETTVHGKFYLKSGVVIEELVTFTGADQENEAKQVLQTIKQELAYSIKNKSNALINFGSLLLCSLDISAVQLECNTL